MKKFKLPSKLRSTRELLFTPIYPPYFFKLVVEASDRFSVSPSSWRLNAMLYLFILGQGFMRIIQGAVILLAASLGVLWREPMALIADMAGSYIFSLFFALIVKKFSF